MYMAPAETLNSNHWAQVLCSTLEKKQTLVLLCSLLNCVAGYQPNGGVFGGGAVPYDYVTHYIFKLVSDYILKSNH
jgi:High-temperature-induced dauer-formation protein